PLLDDLDQHFLAAAENVLNERLGPAGARTAGEAAARATPAMIARAAAAAEFVFFLLLGIRDQIAVATLVVRSFGGWSHLGKELRVRFFFCLGKQVSGLFLVGLLL